MKCLHKLWRKVIYSKTIGEVHVNMGLQEVRLSITALKKTVKALSYLMPLKEVLECPARDSIHT